MKGKTIICQIAACLLLASCSTMLLGPISDPTATSVGVSPPNLSVKILGCTGNKASQTVTLTIEVCNYAPNIENASFGHGHCGGDPVNSIAYDIYGTVYDVGRCSGYFNAKLPTRVPVAVSVEITKVLPGVPYFTYIQLSNRLGYKDNGIALRNIPIIWE